MSFAGLVRDPPPALEPLREIGARLPSLGRAELAALLAPVVERLHEPLPSQDFEAIAPYALAFCRQLYGNARSGDALPLARAILLQAALTQHAAFERRASTVCGLLAADVADIVEAVDHYAHSLRLAGDDPLEASGIWNNIGLAMAIAGNAEMAGRCYQRAIGLLEAVEPPVFARYAACTNLSQSFLETGSFAEGLGVAERALHEECEEFRDSDLMGVLRLRRNLVRLLVALDRVPEAEPHVVEAAALARQVGTPRALIAAATAQAAFEMAGNRTDMALTRLESALTQAREVPSALRDTLACLARAEEDAGNSERALIRLTELSDHVYRFAIERARGHVELAGLDGNGRDGLEQARAQTRARLISKMAPPKRPEAWAALDRLAVSAVLRMDKTGWHGKRVGALCKALAMASGVDALHALEIGLAAEIHDIGMISVPEEILTKKPPLSVAELALVHRHVDAGAEILRDDRHPRVFLAREIVRYHHARWDGTGYPERVGSRFIPFAARVCAIADAYDAMVFGLDACPARSMDAALAELAREAGGQFDPELVARFDRLVRSETEDLGVDIASGSGMEGFQELINALQEDRGFV